MAAQKRDAGSSFGPLRAKEEIQNYFTKEDASDVEDVADEGGEGTACMKTASHTDAPVSYTTRTRRCEE